MAEQPSVREAKKAQNREAIFVTALQLFDEKGYPSTAMNDIAKKLRMATRTLYTYYPNKKDIIFAVPDEYANRLIADLMRKTGEQATVPVLRAFLEWVVANPPPAYFRVNDLKVYEVVFRSQELSEYLAAIKQRVTDAFSYGFAQDFDCEISDPQAKIAGAMTAQAVWSTHALLLPYEGKFTGEAIDEALGTIEGLMGKIGGQFSSG
ncbi:MAG: TetR/AcrR family transcriptional regulator [Candidatus Saccharibacteria bacterium]